MWLLLSLALAEFSPAPSGDAALLQALHEIHRTARAEAAQELGRGERAEVRRLAQELAEGHKAADEAVQNTAAQLGLTLEAGAAGAASLDALSGRQLDRAYVKAQATDHARAVKTLEAAEGKIRDKTALNLWQMELRLLRAFQARAEKLETAL